MKILVIRGGGIGDFVVTLPMLHLLRERWPGAHIELLGQTSIAQLALKRHYLDAIRSVDHGPFARFFAKGAELDHEWMNYMRSFDLVVSYFFDPDDIFQSNLEKCDLVPWKEQSPDTGDTLQKRWLLRGDPRIQSKPAARQLCEPLKALGLSADHFSSRLHPSAEDLNDARKLLPTSTSRLIALHPGSGSPSKNWPLKNWLELSEKISSAGMVPLVIGGEADVEQLKSFSKDPRITLLKNLPLPTLAASLQLCGLYIGHDTGISHIAAASGAKCLLIFGPTDPETWAPPQLSGEVLRTKPDFSDLQVEDVWKKLQTYL